MAAAIIATNLAAGHHDASPTCSAHPPPLHLQPSFTTINNGAAAAAAPPSASPSQPPSSIFITSPAAVQRIQSRQPPSTPPHHFVHAPTRPAHSFPSRRPPFTFQHLHCRSASANSNINAVLPSATATQLRNSAPLHPRSAAIATAHLTGTTVIHAVAEHQPFKPPQLHHAGKRCWSKATE
ncbi:hypothetical protein DEO72_LG11g1643 [Vigna unguiculata]|uniref:Uncharacterized protein n=1 Tax=Vigna unguiculata TaxID=3917 RepID=A0A4D6NLG6_VIGUN|nr:hypothetical protein DEO72_LG11g1643 [Vigna unguiculata]